MMSLEMFMLVFACLAMVYCARLLLIARNDSPLQPLANATDQEPRSKPRKLSPLARWLVTLDIRMPVPLFMLGLIMLSLMVAMLVITFWPSHWQAAVAAFVGSWVLSLYAVSELAAMRVRRFETGLVPALDLMRASLIGGLAPRQAIIATAGVSKGVVKVELLELVKRLELGATIDQALARMLARYNCEGARLFAQSLIAHYRSGGDFTAMLGAVSQLLIERHNQRLHIEGQLSASRYAAIFAGVLPYLLIPLILWKQPEWFDSLRNHPQGPSWIGMAFLCQIVGALWLRKILRVK